MESIVVGEFEVLDRKCIIRKCSIPKEIAHLMEEYHNGYVEIKNGTDLYYSGIDVGNEEITFQGDIDGIEYVGFDTAHYHDTTESKSFEGVKKRLKLFAIAVSQVDR